MSGQQPDGDKLGDLFSDAVAGAPEATFDADDIAAASARATARRQRVVAGVSTLGVVIIAAGVVTSVGLLGQTGDGGTNTAAERATSAGPRNVPQVRPSEAGPTAPRSAGPLVGTGTGSAPQPLPDDPSKQGDGDPGRPGLRAGAPRPGCVQADRELATALAGELPAALREPARRAQVPCPNGARGVALTVRQGPRVGTVSVVLAPERLPTTQQSGTPGAVLSRPVSLRDGNDLLVVSKPDGTTGDGPLRSEVDKIARSVAGKLPLN